MDYVHRALAYINSHRIITGFVVVVLALLFLYAIGFRIGPGVAVTRVGTLELQNLPASTTVYIDQTTSATITKTTTKKFDLLPGSHQVIVSTAGDYPWNDLVAVKSGQTSIDNPILIPEHADVTVLGTSTQATALARIALTKLPTQTNPLHLANGCADVYVSNNQVLADAAQSSRCTVPSYLCLGGTCAPTVIFSPTATIQAVFQFPGRQDAIVVAINNTLYALALDPRNPRFFAPILGATQPSFGTLTDGTIVIKNGSMLYSVKL
jgi:hypothetical protein